jgi:hypothetical protein
MMDKLNLTKEQVENEWNGFTKGLLGRANLVQDWLALYAEVERLEKVNEVLNSTIQDVY